jgi:hypothetical protein
MTESGHFASRPWTQADDEKLRRLAPTGLSSRAIGIRTNRTETAVRSRARQLQVILRKIKKAGLLSPSETPPERGQPEYRYSEQ